MSIRYGAVILVLGKGPKAVLGQFRGQLGLSFLLVINTDLAVRGAVIFSVLRGGRQLTVSPLVLFVVVLDRDLAVCPTIYILPITVGTDEIHRLGSGTPGDPLETPWPGSRHI